MTGRVDGRVALVTGAASPNGIGFAVAKRLAAEGAIVTLTDIDEAGVRERARGLTGRGWAATGLGHDVRLASDWQRIGATLEAAHGGLDILVNNAGILRLNPVEQVKPEDWNLQLEINLTGPFIGTQIMAPLMRARGGGSIVNMSSVAGLIGVPNNSAYAATKGGVRLFSKSAAIDLAADGIRVNSVHPGFIMTDMQDGAREGLGAENYDRFLDSIPLKRAGTPDDVADCVLFLASDESRYITGAEFVVDGGLSAG